MYKNSLFTWTWWSCVRQSGLDFQDTNCNGQRWRQRRLFKHQ